MTHKARRWRDRFHRDGANQFIVDRKEPNTRVVAVPCGVCFEPLTRASNCQITYTPCDPTNFTFEVQPGRTIDVQMHSNSPFNTTISLPTGFEPTPIDASAPLTIFNGSDWRINPAYFLPRTSPSSGSHEIPALQTFETFSHDEPDLLSGTYDIASDSKWIFAPDGSPCRQTHTYPSPKLTTTVEYLSIGNSGPPAATNFVVQRQKIRLNLPVYDDWEITDQRFVGGQYRVTYRVFTAALGTTPTTSQLKPFVTPDDSDFVGSFYDADDPTSDNHPLRIDGIIYTGGNRYQRYAQWRNRWNFVSGVVKQWWYGIQELSIIRPHRFESHRADYLSIDSFVAVFPPVVSSGFGAPNTQQVSAEDPVVNYAATVVRTFATQPNPIPPPDGILGTEWNLSGNQRPQAIADLRYSLQFRSRDAVQYEYDVDHFANGAETNANQAPESWGPSQLTLFGVNTARTVLQYANMLPITNPNTGVTGYFPFDDDFAEWRSGPDPIHNGEFAWDKLEFKDVLELNSTSLDLEFPQLRTDGTGLEVVPRVVIATVATTGVTWIRKYNP